MTAAESGDAESQFNLGILFDSRLDDNYRATEGNRDAAIEWLGRAARQGLPRAQTKLAELYAERPSSPDDLIKAHAWFALAAENAQGARRQESRSGLDRVSARLSPPQRARADGLAKALMRERSGG